MNCIILSTTLIPSVLLCGHNQLSYLQEKGKLNFRYINIKHICNEAINWADIIIFVRSENHKEALVAKKMKGIKHLVYVLDDDLLNVPDGLSCSKMYQNKAIHQNIIDIIKCCDTFLTTSPVLLEKYGSWCKRCFLINEPCKSYVLTKQKNTKVKIGFAGSIDRTKDINDILTSAIEQILLKYKDKVEIEFMGAKPEIVDKYHLKHIPYQNGYDKYVETMKQANWDIGLAPMPITPFHSCKYFNKYVEYASFGIAGIYTKAEPYIFGIKDGYNGLLVPNQTKLWVEAISKLIEEEDLRKKIIKNCLKESKEIYSLEKCSEDYLNKILMDYQQYNGEAVNISFWEYTLCYLKKLKYKIQEKGLLFPFWACLYLLKKAHLVKDDN